jgi:hypothetical protein
MEIQVSQSLQELLENVQAAEPDATEWAGVQSRVLSAMSSASSGVTHGHDDFVEPSDAAPHVETTRTTNWKWLGGGLAMGGVVAGLLLANQPGADAPSDSENSTRIEPVLAPHPVVLDAIIPEFGAEVWSPRATSRKARAHARVAAASEVPNEIASAPATPKSEVRALGESDVEYDRRHLAPVDAALQAHQPRQALQLLAKFQPRKLTSYAQALRAIALCTAGEGDAGKRLGEQTLPQLTNRGLASRVQAACKLRSERK